MSPRCPVRGAAREPMKPRLPGHTSGAAGIRRNGRAQWARLALSAVAVTLLFAAAPARAEDSEVEQLKATVEQMQKTMDAMKTRLEQLEKERAAQPAPAAAPAAEPQAAPVIAPQGAGPAKVQQEAELPKIPAPAAAEGAYEPNVIVPQGIGLQKPDPTYRGFIQIPNTKVMIRFNAKPRVDFTYDTANSGNKDRFVTGQIPVEGNPLKGGGPVFNINAKASQLIIDVRAPGADGDPQFYYQNDFFGSSGGEFPYRVQQLYGRIYNLTLGQTYSVFEDPDIWPDTVDYEGPNSMIFGRWPLARYKLPLDDEWALNFGVEKPDAVPSDVFFTNSAGQLVVEPVTGTNQAPDFTLGTRWDREDVGHMQFSTVFRDLGARSENLGISEHVFGWGLNLSGHVVVFGRDKILAQLTYGHGIGRYGNDTGFFATDAAVNPQADLVALPYFGAFIGYTHHWSETFRSTATYGFVDMDNQPSQGPDAYRQTDYVSGNVIWQMRQRLSVGLEGLYGHNELSSGNTGAVGRVQISVAYAIF